MRLFGGSRFSSSLRRRRVGGEVRRGVKAVDKLPRAAWREASLSDLLPRISVHAKKDGSFVPMADPRTERWHVQANGEFELVLTGPQFWDTRARKGGGGAIDLVMHLWGCNYREALKRLRSCQSL